jgi:hypothetical protein
MADFLDEDIPIATQKYCVLSYTLPPKNDSKGKLRAGFDTPMIKIRGCYSSVEECEKRILKLKQTDTYFNMYVTSVGIWGPLLTDEQHREQNTEEEFMNKDMNEFMKSYKENHDKKAQEFKERKDKLVELATKDGTPEGQAILAAKKEHPLSVKQRIETTKLKIEELKKELQEAQQLYDSSVELYSSFTEEELRAATI